MKMLYIIRGIPGSGKSTLAKKIASVACEVDDFFVDPDGVYRFDPSLLKEAHSACQKKVCDRNAVRGGRYRGCRHFHPQMGIPAVHQSCKGIWV